MSRYMWTANAVSMALLLSGCATFSSDGELGDVSAVVEERTGQPIQRAERTADSAQLDPAIVRLLAEPLTADAAVKIALINNQGLQASLDELGVAESNLVEAGRLHNPGFTFADMRGDGDSEIDRGVMFDVVGLLALPARRKIEREHFEQAKLQLAAKAVRLAADTRRAYFNAIAAQQAVQFMEKIHASTQAGAELAQKMAKAGSANQLETLRQEAYYAEVKVRLARVRQDAVGYREHLIRLLGLAQGNPEFILPDRLPELPSAPRQMNGSEAEAMQQRLDVQMARRNTEATAKALDLIRATGFINVLDAGYRNMSTNFDPHVGGYEITLEIPLFDWGEAKNRKAQSMYMAALHRTADAALRARSQVRTAYSAYRTSYDLAIQYRDEIVPLRKKIADEVLLRYNGMLISTFELLADAREQAASVNAAIEAQRDFWLADTDLQMAINGDGFPATEMVGRPMTSPKMSDIN